MFGRKETTDLEVFTLCDTKVGNYWLPIFDQNQFNVVRTLSEMIENTIGKPDQQPQWVRHPEDFILFKIGTYDRKTGELKTHKMEHVVNIIDLSIAANQKVAKRPDNGQLALV